MQPPAWRRLSGWPIQLALLGLAVAAAYSRTLDVPFYLDDYSSILENDLIYRWQGFLALWRFAPMRVLGYASFALDYRLGHFDPALYHVTNIVIHFLAATAVFALTRGLLRTPRLAGRVSPAARAGWPLLAALLFALHPLQTSAVTYVVQRLASLAALFYIAALACFLEARLAGAPRARALWSALCLLCAGCALLSKENAATLPLALVLLECCFFARDAGAMLRAALAGVAGMALLWFVVAAIFGRNPLSLEAMRPLTTDATSISRPAYFATQLPALWTYIRSFFWPAGLHLDHADEHLDGFAHPVVWAALAAHLLVVALALWAWRSRPQVTFALLFYYLAHVMESSLFPLQDMIFEHRAYLPDLGLCLLVGWGLLGEPPGRRGGARIATAVAACVVLALGITTFERNQAWRDPLALWRGNVRLAPTKARAWGSLARELIQAHQPAEAAAALRRSIELRSARGESHPLDLVNLAVALQMMGQRDSALALIERGLAAPMEPRVRARFLLNRGNLAYESGRFAAAEADYREALALDLAGLEARVNLASALAQTGRLAEAETLYREVLDVDPANSAAQENLSKVRAALGARP